MWTLVFWFFVLPADVRGLGSVPGFTTKAACEKAGPTLAKAVLESVPVKDARVSFVCAATDELTPRSTATR